MAAKTHRVVLVNGKSHTLMRKGLKTLVFEEGVPQHVTKATAEKLKEAVNQVTQVSGDTRTPVSIPRFKIDKAKEPAAKKAAKPGAGEETDVRER